MSPSTPGKVNTVDLFQVRGKLPFSIFQIVQPSKTIGMRERKESRARLLNPVSSTQTIDFNVFLHLSASETGEPQQRNTLSTLTDSSSTPTMYSLMFLFLSLDSVHVVHRLGCSLFQALSTFCHGCVGALIALRGIKASVSLSLRPALERLKPSLTRYLRSRNVFVKKR